MKEMEFKAGDKVFSFKEGFVTLEHNYDSVHYPLRTGGRTYTVNGKRVSDDKHRSLLTLEEAKLLGIEIPKKKVEVKRWANVYLDNSAIMHRTKEAADGNADTSKRIACVEMTGEYFIEDV